LTPDAVLARRSLRPRKVLQERAGRRVLLAEAPDGARFVLKQVDPGAAGTRVERAFLRSVRDRAFRFLRLPRLVDEGDDYLVTEFVAREARTGATILERRWSESDVALWVDALREFQEIEMPAAPFTRRQRLAGSLYPVVRALDLWRRFGARMPAGAARALPGLLARNIAARPSVRLVATHYDFHTYNYAFCTGEDRMSLLDFEFSYYLGDPLWDLLYFLTQPETPLDAWTFQPALFRRFLEGRTEAALATRVRLILLVQCLGRALNLPGDSPRYATYFANAERLCDDRWFRRWFAALASASS
jgi:hypothetical protein